MTDPFSSADEAKALLDRLGVDATSGTLESSSPIDGGAIGRVEVADAAAVGDAVGRAHRAFLDWRTLPAPRRGELVRLFGEELRREKRSLGLLVSLEAGKIIQ